MKKHKPDPTVLILWIFLGPLASLLYAWILMSVSNAKDVLMVWIALAASLIWTVGYPLTVKGILSNDFWPNFLKGLVALAVLAGAAFLFVVASQSGCGGGGVYIPWYVVAIVVVVALVAMSSK